MPTEDFLSNLFKAIQIPIIYGFILHFSNGEMKPYLLYESFLLEINKEQCLIVINDFDAG